MISIQGFITRSYRIEDFLKDFSGSTSIEAVQKPQAATRTEEFQTRAKRALLFLLLGSKVPIDYHKHHRFLI